MHRLKLCTALALSSLGTATFIVSPAQGVGTLAGTEISCWSNATYTDEQGNLVGQVSSNVLVMTVAKMRDVVVTPPSRDVDAPVGATSVVPATIKNNSNSAESYSVSATSSSGWVAKVYLDENGDGVWQEGEKKELETTDPLPPDSSLRVLVKVTVPANIQTGLKDPVTLRVKALGDGPPAQTAGIYTLTTAPDLPQLSIIASPASPAIGDPFYLTVRTSPAKAVQLKIRSLAPDGVRKVTTITTDADGQAMVTDLADCSGTWTLGVQYASFPDSEPSAAQTAMRCMPMSYETVGSDMVSLPVQLTNSATGNLFDSALGVSLTKWLPSSNRWAAYSAFNNQTNDSGLQTLATGQAYSTYAPVISTIAPEGRLINQTEPFSIDLQRGWNQIGSPFLNPVAWSACRVQYNGQVFTPAQAKANNLMLDYAWTVVKNNSVFDYSVVHSELPDAEQKLNPWRGYWVYAYQPARLIVNPTPAADDVPALGQGEWIVKIAAGAPAAKDTSNFFGVSANRNLHGVINPPRPTTGDYEDLYFPTDSGKYASDIRSSISGATTWTFEVATTETNLLHTITWSSANSLPAGYSMTLTDLQNYRETDMQATVRYVYKPTPGKGTYKFQISVSPDAGR